MSNSILSKDTDLKFPSFTILRASAGSGKTHTLAKRFVQFIVSDKVPKNSLRNILAITFSNNAAKEMKQRVLLWLKEISLRHRDRISELLEIVSMDEDRLVRKAENLMDEILLNYSDFQIKTIDSFMSSIYKSSAIDLGYSPDFDILLSKDTSMAYAFHRFLANVKLDTKEALFIEGMLDLIREGKSSETPYMWDPSKVLLEEIKGLSDKISSFIKDILIPDIDKEIDQIKKEISKTAKILNLKIEESSFKRNNKSGFSKILDSIEKNDYSALISSGLKIPPIHKPKDNEKNLKYQDILNLWTRLGDLIRRYSQLFSFNYYQPYLKVYKAFEEILERTKREEHIVFIDDINKKLSLYLNKEIIPDIYFQIGDTVYHYLIDEFQDTSLIQWTNLFPLIENSLSQGGSFFAVGDTKQAIYGFRNADYRIMRRLESKNPFPSAHHEVKELKVNHRSLERIVSFNKAFFQKIIPSYEEYGEAAKRSGLSDYIQEIRKENKGKGHVEIDLFEKNEDEPMEKEKLKLLIQALLNRGYSYSDIAILTQRNDDVIKVSTWLNEIEVPFISYSSLDIRARKLSQEIFFLVQFLNSPLDQFSFGGFLLGEIFRKALKRSELSMGLDEIHKFILRNRRRPPLYKRFQEEFPILWDRYFDNLFRNIGFLPLYELINEIYQNFDVFEIFKQEEATLVKILEVVKDLESQGINSPIDFIRFASNEISGEEGWDIEVPEGINAIKVMTIHKAKGLEFPVVILILYGEQTRGFKYIINEEDEGIYVIKLNRNISEANEDLLNLYEEERYMELSNKLNMLYVGFTRPRFELYIIGVRSQKSQFPINILKDGMDLHFKADIPETFSRISPKINHIEIYHSKRPIDLSSFSLQGELNIMERKRGELFHKILCNIEYLHDHISEELVKKINSLKEEFNMDLDVEEVKEEILNFLNVKEIKPFFIWREGRIILREHEFSDSEGNLLRMDRVVIDKEKLTVIDYKTGFERKQEEKYIEQLKGYINVLKNIYQDKTIEGLITYVDLKEVVMVH